MCVCERGFAIHYPISLTNYVDSSLPPSGKTVKNWQKHVEDTLKI